MRLNGHCEPRLSLDMTPPHDDRTALSGFWRQGGKCGLRHGDWKIVRMGGRKSPGKSQWELYNLSEDLSEETNLAQSDPERLTELMERWEKMNTEMAEPLF